MSKRTATDLEQIFRSDVEKIANRFIEAFGLTFEKKVENLSFPLYRWLEFVRMRYVIPARRQVFFSRGFWRRAPEEARIAVDDCVHRVRRGEDINAYQGQGLTTHDVSGAKQVRRTDLLLADFGIHHFHITDEPVAPGRYSRRSDWLLFGVVQANALLCIGVQPHPKGVEWAQKEAFELAVKNWPQAFAHAEAKKVTGGNWSDEEINHLRRHGGTALHAVASRVYGPVNGGLTSAGTPILVHLAADRVLLTG